MHFIYLYFLNPLCGWFIVVVGGCQFIKITLHFYFVNFATIHLILKIGTHMYTSGLKYQLRCGKVSHVRI